MEYTKLGRSNMTVSKICLGTMHFGPYASEAEAFEILDRTLELGINFIDTANVYGGDGHQGRSEAIIGNWFARRPEVRDQVVLATKVYNPMLNHAAPNDEHGFSAYKVRKQVADSLRRLQTNRIDLYQVPITSTAASPPRSFGEHLKSFLPTATCSTRARATFPDGASLRRRCRLGSAALPVSFLNKHSITCSTEFPNSRCFPPHTTFGIGIIAYMPLAGGLLTGKTQAAEGSRTRQLEEEYDIKLGAENNQFTDFSALCRELGEREHVVATSVGVATPRRRFGYRGRSQRSAVRRTRASSRTALGTGGHATLG